MDLSWQSRVLDFSAIAELITLFQKSELVKCFNFKMRLNRLN